MKPTLQGLWEIDLAAVLRYGLWPELRAVTCDVCEDRIVLRGRVPSFYIKQVAQSLILERVQHSVMLENRLEVSPPTDEVSLECW